MNSTDQNNKGPQRRRPRASSFYQARSEDGSPPQIPPYAEAQDETSSNHQPLSYWDLIGRQINTQFQQAFDTTCAAVMTAKDEISKVAKDAGRATVSATRLASNLTREHPVSQLFSQKINPQQSEPSDISACDESEIFDKYLDDAAPVTDNNPLLKQYFPEPYCNWEYPAASYEFQGTADREEKIAATDDDAETVTSIQTEGTDDSAHTDVLDSSSHSNTLPNLIPLTPPTRQSLLTAQAIAQTRENPETQNYNDTICNTRDNTKTSPTMAQTCSLNNQITPPQPPLNSSFNMHTQNKITDNGDTDMSKSADRHINKTCPVAKHSPLLDDYIYQYPPQATEIHLESHYKVASAIVHDIGYCAPAALGLILIELFNKNALSGALHSAPTQLLLRLFKAHYQLEFSTVNDLLQYLRGRDVHTLQWIMAPILRLLLLCILHTKSAKTSDIFFESNDENVSKTSIEENPFLDFKSIHSVFDISDADLQTCSHLLREANTSPKSPHLNSISGYDQPFSTDDLFLVCRNLFIPLKLYCAVDTSETTACKDMKKILHSQITSRESQQAQLYKDLPDSTWVSIHYQAYIFDDSSGVMGHFDCILGDKILNQPCWINQQHQQPSVRDLHQKSRLAHANGPEFIKQLPTLEKTSAEPENISGADDKPNDHNHFFDDLKLSLDQYNQKPAMLKKVPSICHLGADVLTEAPLSEIGIGDIGMLLDEPDTTHHGSHGKASEDHSTELQLGTDSSAFNKVSRNNVF